MKHQIECLKKKKIVALNFSDIFCAAICRYIYILFYCFLNTKFSYSFLTGHEY